MTRALGRGLPVAREGVLAPRVRWTGVFPYPPSLNTLWRHVGNRTIKSAEGRAYEIAVGLRMNCGRPWTVAPPYRVTIMLWPPDRRRRDVDNVAKALLDAVWRSIGQDDSTIDELHVYRREVDRVGPRCELWVEALS